MGKKGHIHGPKLRTPAWLNWFNNCLQATTCSMEAMTVDKGSEYFVVIQHFRCFLSSHGFLILFSLPFPTLPFQWQPLPCVRTRVRAHTHTHTHTEPGLRSRIWSETRPWTTVSGPLMSPLSLPDFAWVPAPLTPTADLFHWLIISASQCSKLWFSWFPTWHCDLISAF